jgi:hypothetical protein
LKCAHPILHVLHTESWGLSLNSYAAKDTICGYFFDKKDPKLSLSELLSMMTITQFNPTLFIWPSMWTRLEHAHCLETINNMWFLGVLCYSLTIICCCQVQNYIYHITYIIGIIINSWNMKNDWEKKATCLGLPIKQNRCHFSVNLDA